MNKAMWDLLRPAREAKKIRNVCLANMPDQAETVLHLGVATSNIAKAIARREMMLILIGKGLQGNLGHNVPDHLC